MQLNAALAEGRKESLFPALGVDFPAHFSFASSLQRCAPGRAVTIILRNIQAIHYSHPPGEFTLCFNVDVVIAPFRSDGGIQSQTHGNRIGKRDSILARLYLVCPSRVTVAFDGKVSKGRIHTLDARDVAFIHNSLSPRE